jgi:hypothetical protein
MATMCFTFPAAYDQIKITFDGRHGNILSIKSFLLFHFYPLLGLMVIIAE